MCMTCTKELVEAENRQLSREGFVQSLLAETYHVLKRHSVFENETLRDMTLADYTTDCEEQKVNLEKVNKVGSAIINGEAVNVWMTGRPGRGKSHLAVAILNAVNEYGKKRMMKAIEEDRDPRGEGFSCLFISFAKMLQLIRGSYNKKDSPYTEEYFINLCGQVDILVIDDLGAESGAIEEDEQATKFVHRVLYAITNARVGKTTIYTTNLKKDQRAHLYDDKLLSRIYQNIAEIVFKDSLDMRHTEFEW